MGYESDSYSNSLPGIPERYKSAFEAYFNTESATISDSRGASQLGNIREAP